MEVPRPAGRSAGPQGARQRPLDLALPRARRPGVGRRHAVLRGRDLAGRRRLRCTRWMPSTGRVVWSNTDSQVIEQANVDHGVKSPAGFSPQGYLAVVGDKLIVPCGASCRGSWTGGPANGKPTRWAGAASAGLAKGTWFAAGIGPVRGPGRRSVGHPAPQRRTFRHAGGQPAGRQRLQATALSRRVHPAAGRIPPVSASWASSASRCSRRPPCTWAQPTKASWGTT